MLNEIIHKSNYYCLSSAVAIIFVIIFLSFGVYADDLSGLKNGDFLEKSAIRGDKIIIKNKNYKIKGYFQPSTIDPRKTILYDSDGNSRGYFQTDVLDNRKFRFHKAGDNNLNGTLTIDNDNSYLKRSVIDPQKTILYDSNGNSKGYFRKDVIDSRKLRFYEKK